MSRRISETKRAPPTRCPFPTNLQRNLSPHLLSKLLLELLQLGGNHRLTIRLRCVVVVVQLVIVLGRVELRHRLHTGDDGLRKRLRSVQSSDGLFRLLCLLVRRIKNHRPVLLADIVALPVYGRRIVHREKHFEQIAIADLAGIKGHLHDLGVPRVAIAYLPVRRIVDVPAHIPRHRRRHPRQPVKDGLDTPETSSSKYCGLFIRHAHWMPNSPESSVTAPPPTSPLTPSRWSPNRSPPAFDSYSDTKTRLPQR